MMTDKDFLKYMEEIERAATNIKNEFRAYNFNDYIEREHNIKNVKAKAKVLHDMLDRMVQNKIALMSLAHDAVNHRRQLIKQIADNPHVKENWEVIMMALMMISD